MKIFRQRGDTLVEVLIAIAVAAFAIGTAYSISNKSLQHAISARERNESLNIAESQIADLKYRYKTPSDDNPTFQKYLAIPASWSPGPLPAYYQYFCLDDSSDGPTKAGWLPTYNNFLNYNESLNIGSGNKYNTSGCIQNVNGTSYYVNISDFITSASQNAAKRTVYRVDVRWSQVGGGLGSTTLYYRF